MNRGTEKNEVRGEVGSSCKVSYSYLAHSRTQTASLAWAWIIDKAYANFSTALCSLKSLLCSCYVKVIFRKHLDSNLKKKAK